MNRRRIRRSNSFLNCILRGNDTTRSAGSSPQLNRYKYSPFACWACAPPSASHRQNSPPAPLAESAFSTWPRALARASANRRRSASCRRKHEPSSHEISPRSVAIRSRPPSCRVSPITMPGAIAAQSGSFHQNRPFSQPRSRFCRPYHEWRQSREMSLPLRAPSTRPSEGQMG